MSVPVYDTYYHKFRANYKKDSTEGIANTKYILSHMINDYGWSFEAVCGLLGNGASESGLNPNRPEESGYTVDGVSYPSSDWFPSNVAHGVTRGRYGFGLLQWTPWWKTYSGTGQDPSNGDDMGHPTLYYWFQNVYKGGTANRTDNNPLGDLKAQLQYTNDVPWGWISGYNRWKSHGSKYYYPVTFAQYKQMTNAGDAARAWALNFERPGAISSSSTTFEKASASLNSRQKNAEWFAERYFDEFGGGGPGPTPGRFPVWLLFKFKGRGLKTW